MFFSYNPEDGFSTHETLADAKTAAQDAIDWYRDDAGDGWSESVQSVCYGKILGMADQNDMEPAPEGSDFDCYVDYSLIDLPNSPVMRSPQNPC